MPISALAAFALLLNPAPLRGPDSVVVFMGVSVLSMRSPEVTPKQSVVVRNGKIEVIGPSSHVQIPPGALRVEGRGRYLMPGLADFHTHVAERGDLALMSPAVSQPSQTWGARRLLSLAGAIPSVLV